MSELLPCPFCGGEPDEYEGEYGNGIYCMQCGAMVGEPIHLGFNVAERVSYEQAAKAWNTRVETVFVTGTTTVTDTPQITYVPERTCHDLNASARSGVSGSEVFFYYDNHRDSSKHRHIPSETVAHRKRTIYTAAFICPECGWVSRPFAMFCDDMLNYCPNCGAKVVRE